MNIQAHPAVPAEEQNCRREAIERARWHNRMEGLGKPSEEILAINERWISGLISEEEHDREIRSLVLASVRKRGH